MAPSIADVLQWTEEWWAPGVCLLARSRVALRAPSSRRDGCMPSGIWLFAHGREAMLVDAPFAHEDAERVLLAIERFLSDRGLVLKFFSASHLHLGHAAGLERVGEHFPDAVFVHPAFWPEHYRTLTFDSLVTCARLARSHLWERRARIAYEDESWLDLSGEPLVLVRAPYHSPTDQVVVFRGVALTPDWHLPADVREELDDVTVPPEQARMTIRRLLALERDYAVHSFVNVHADWPLRGDFVARLEIALAALRR